MQLDMTPTVPELNEANSCDRDTMDDDTLHINSTSQGTISFC